MLMVLGVLLSVPGFAFDLGGKKVDVTLSSSVVSRYIWRGQDLYANNDGAYQPSVDVVVEDIFSDVDLGFNVWGSFPLNKGHEDLEELDYTMSLSKDLTDSISLSLGYTYFDYPNTGKTADVQEPWMSLGFGKIPGLGIDITPSIFLGYDMEAASGGIDAGWYYSFGFDTELPFPQCALFKQGQTLAISVVNWGNDGVADLKPSFVYATDIGFSTTYDLGQFSVTPSFHYVLNYEDEINSGNDETWAGIEIAYAF